MNSRKLAVFLSICALLPASSMAVEENAEEQRIRQIVSQMLAARDAEVQRLQSRIEALESVLEQQRQQPGIRPSASAPAGQDPVKPEVQVSRDEQHKFNSELDAIKTRLAEVNTTEGLAISGFFDVSARSENPDESTFTLGAVEMDLEYTYGDYTAYWTNSVYVAEQLNADFYSNFATSLKKSN